MTIDQHTVHAFDDELDALNDVVARMGGLAEAQFAAAIEALTKRNTDLAASTVKEDARIDELDDKVDDLTTSLLALRTPVARDLRNVLAALKIARTLERIGDYSANIAKRAMALNQVPPVPPAQNVARMGRPVQQMIKDVLDAYVEHDVDKAISVWQRDEEVDSMHNSLFRDLMTHMGKEPASIASCTHLLFVNKNIERISDLATNIAEYTHFMVRGKPLSGERPKADSTSYTVIDIDAETEDEAQ